MQYRKVLVVSNMYPNVNFPSYGVFVKNFCDQIDELGINYKLACITKTNNKIIKVLKYFIFYVFTFLRAVFGDYDLVYIHYPSFSAAPVIMARKFRKFIIFTNVHGTDVVPLKKAQERMVFNTKKAVEISQKVIVPSEYYKNIMIKNYILDANKVVVYPSAGVNGDVFFEYERKQKEDLRNQYNIDEDTVVIGYVSRINRAKGWDVFIDSLNGLEKCINKKLRIFIVGSGEDDQELVKRLELCHPTIREAIVRYPLLEQRKLAEIYNLLDLFVFPTMSPSESLGLVAIEAMACGCPVIASDYAAPKYYVIDGYNGFKFKKGDSFDLKSKIVSFFGLSPEARELLKKGAISSADSYRKNNIIALLKNVFE